MKLLRTIVTIIASYLLWPIGFFFISSWGLAACGRGSSDFSSPTIEIQRIFVEYVVVSLVWFQRWREYFPFHIWDIYGIYNPVIMSSHWRTPSFFKMGTLHQQPVCGIGNWLAGAKRREFSGMIHFITSNNHPSNPQQPIHSLLILSTSKLKDLLRTNHVRCIYPGKPTARAGNTQPHGIQCQFPPHVASMCQIQRHGIGGLPRITCHYFKVWMVWFVTSGMPVFIAPNPVPNVPYTNSTMKRTHLTSL